MVLKLDLTLHLVTCALNGDDVFSIPVTITIGNTFFKGNVLTAALVSRNTQAVSDLLNFGAHCINDLIECIPNVTRRDVRYNVTPLSVATRFLDVRVVKMMLDKGANPNVVCDITPLGVAVRRNHMELVKLLVAAGADLNMMIHPMSGQRMRLGASQSNETKIMQTPLHIACRRGHTTIARYLLQHGAAPDVADEMKELPIQTAFRRGRLDIVSDLLHRVLDFDVLQSQYLRYGSFSSDYSCLLFSYLERHNHISSILINHIVFACIVEQIIKHAACFSHLQVSYQTRFFRYNMQRTLASHQDRTVNTLLRLACAAGHEVVVTFLLYCGADVNAVDSRGHNSLHHACIGGQRAIAQRLIDHGVYKNARDATKQTPLHLACSNGCQSLVEVLLYQGAHANSENLEQQTPLHYACTQGHSQLIDVLEQNNAKLNNVDSSGRSPLASAFHGGHNSCVAKLLSCGVTVEDELANASNPTVQSIVAVAITSQHYDIAKQLLERGCFFGAKNNVRLIASLFQVLIDKRRLDMVVMLIKAGYCEPDSFSILALSQEARPVTCSRILLLLKWWKWLAVAGIKISIENVDNLERTPIARELNKTSEYMDIMHELRREIDQPKSLQQLSTHVIRKRLITVARGKSILPFIERLPFPKQLRGKVRLEGFTDEPNIFNAPSVCDLFQCHCNTNNDAINDEEVAAGFGYEKFYVHTRQRSYGVLSVTSSSLSSLISRHTEQFQPKRRATRATSVALVIPSHQVQRKREFRRAASPVLRKAVVRQSMQRCRIKQPAERRML